MIFNNGNINRTDGLRARSAANYSGTNGPSAPLAGRPGQGMRKADPSSATRADKYPIPSMFDYRSKPREFDIS